MDDAEKQKYVDELRAEQERDAMNAELAGRSLWSLEEDRIR